MFSLGAIIQLTLSPELAVYIFKDSLLVSNVVVNTAVNVPTFGAYN